MAGDVNLEQLHAMQFGRVYPATGAAPLLPSDGFNLKLTPVKIITQADLDAAVATERARWEGKARDMAANYRSNGLAAEADGLESLVTAVRGYWA